MLQKMTAGATAEEEDDRRTDEEPKVLDHTMVGVAGGMEGWRDGGMVEEVGRRTRLPSERTIGLTAGG